MPSLDCRPLAAVFPVHEERISLAAPSALQLILINLSLLNTYSSPPLSQSSLSAMAPSINGSGLRPFPNGV